MATKQGTEPDLRFQISVETELARLAARMSAAMNHVVLGLAAIPTLPDGEVQIPQAFFHLGFGVKPHSSVETRTEWSRWLIGIGLREAVDAISLVTEEVYRIAEMLRRTHADQLVAHRKITGPMDFKLALDEMLQPGLGKFESAGLRGKLDILGKEFGIKPVWEEETMSINKARTCLTHRMGLVGVKDINDQDQNQLKVSFRSLRLIVKDTNGHETPIAGPMDIEPGSQIGLQSGVENERCFRLNEWVAFTREDCIFMMLTLFEFGKSLFIELIRFCERTGIPNSARVA